MFIPRHVPSLMLNDAQAVDWAPSASSIPADPKNTKQRIIAGPPYQLNPKASGTRRSFPPSSSPCEGIPVQFMHSSITRYKIEASNLTSASISPKRNVINKITRLVSLYSVGINLEGSVPAEVAHTIVFSCGR